MNGTPLMSFRRRHYLSPSEFLLQAEDYLSAEDVAELRQKVEKHLRNQQEWFRQEAVRAENELERLKARAVELERMRALRAPARQETDSFAMPGIATLVFNGLDAKHVGANIEAGINFSLPDVDGASLARLIKAFASANPGAKASDFVAFIQRHRPKTDSNVIYAELYRLSKDADGPLRKIGEKPNTRYFLAEEHPEVAKQGS